MGTSEGADLRRRVGLGITTNYGVIAAKAAFLLVTTPVMIDAAGAAAFATWPSGRIWRCSS